ncbi:hypothetical protein GF407_11365 [candidate division KSB1 bacterium]|nr:hypothetical protein [candidate division KSB1 bacterium]
MNWNLRVVQAVLLCSCLVTAAEYYVSPSGNDLYDGTSLGTPFQTIQKAADIAQAGDIVYVREGVYHEKPRFHNSGTASAPITVCAYQNETPFVDGSKSVGPWTVHAGSIFVSTILSIETITGHPNYGNPVIVGQVTVDDSLLVQAASLSAMTPGSFYQEGSSLYVWTPLDDSPANHMTGIIKAFTDAKDWNEPALLYISGSYVDLSGFVFQNNSGYGGFTTGSHIKFHHNTVRFITGNGFIMQSGYGNEISDCELYESNLSNWPRDPSPEYPWGTGIGFNGGSDGRIVRNRVYRNHGEGITLGGSHAEVVTSDHCTVQDNIVFNNYSVGVYLHGCSNSVVDRNIIYTTADYYTPSDSRTLTGIVAAVESLNGDLANLTDNTVTNNLVINCQTGFAFFEDYPGAGLQNFLIANNTFVNSKWVGAWVAPGNHSDTRFYNNIFFKYDWWEMIQIETNTGIEFANNCYYNAAGDQYFRWNGVLYNSLPAWQAATGQGTGGIWGDPRFTEVSVAQSFTNFVILETMAEQYDLTEMSPCIDSGQFLSAVTTDVWGTPRPSATSYDIGAVEYCQSVCELEVKLFLEGPWRGEVMSDELRSKLPLDSPFTRNLRQASQIPLEAVDWVLLEIRTSNGQVVVADTSVFINRYGQLITDYGRPRIGIPGLPEGTYHVLCRTRNHLPIMSRMPISFIYNAPASVDWTTNPLSVYDPSCCVKKNSDPWLVRVGDINQDHQITTLDYVQLLNSWYQMELGYTLRDLDYNGRVDRQDYELWHKNAKDAAHSYLP